MLRWEAGVEAAGRGCGKRLRGGAVGRGCGAGDVAGAWLRPKAGVEAAGRGCGTGDSAERGCGTRDSAEKGCGTGDSAERGCGTGDSAERGCGTGDYAERGCGGRLRVEICYVIYALSCITASMTVPAARSQNLQPRAYSVLILHNILPLFTNNNNMPTICNVIHAYIITFQVYKNDNQINSLEESVSVKNVTQVLVYQLRACSPNYVLHYRPVSCWLARLNNSKLTENYRPILPVPLDVDCWIKSCTIERIIGFLRRIILFELVHEGNRLFLIVIFMFSPILLLCMHACDLLVAIENMWPSCCRVVVFLT